MIKKLLKKIFSTYQLRGMRTFFARGTGSVLNKNLDVLGKLYGTDKTSGHSYLQHYATHFNRFRTQNINLLEIGVGGYKDPKLGGESLRMWKNYFQKANIFGLDIYDKSPLEESRIKIFKGSQVDTNFLDKVIQTTGDLDIIIDDGSHINEHVITTFKYLFPKLKDGGIYIIEDTQTAYWEDYGGDSKNLNNSKTMTNFFKSLTDGLNHEEFILPDYKKSYFDQKIISMHFYHNLIFIYKGDNNEKSNLVVNNAR